MDALARTAANGGRIMPIGNGYQTYSDSTLKNLKKDTLIEYIRVLEENLRNAYERLDNQAKILHELRHDK